jgi:hypothetical protein
MPLTVVSHLIRDCRVWFTGRFLADGMPRATASAFSPLCRSDFDNAREDEYGMSGASRPADQRLLVLYPMNACRAPGAEEQPRLGAAVGMTCNNARSRQWILAVYVDTALRRLLHRRAEQHSIIHDKAKF